MMRAHVWHRDPDGVRNAACAVVTDRSVLEIFLIGGELRQDRLRRPVKDAPGEGPRSDEACEQRDDPRTGGAVTGPRLHPLPRQIKKDRLRCAEDEIEQPEN